MTDEEFMSKLNVIEAELMEARREISFIKDTIIKADATITKVASEVMPTVEALTKSPMLKMLMPKGK